MRRNKNHNLVVLDSHVIDLQSEFYFHSESLYRIIHRMPQKYLAGERVRGGGYQLFRRTVHVNWDCPTLLWFSRYLLSLSSSLHCDFRNSHVIYTHIIKDAAWTSQMLYQIPSLIHLALTYLWGKHLTLEGINFICQCPR